MTVLDQVAPAWPSLDVYEPSPGGAASRRIRRETARDGGSYTPSQFFADVPRGQRRDGVRSEDLERLTFPDDSFDVVVSQDVMEHVADPAAAMTEIARVLRPGGRHVWTVPYRSDRLHSTPRARRNEDGELVLLAEPEYHHDPVDPQGTLVTTDWGADLPDLVEAWSGLRTRVFALHDRSRGLDGEYPEVFVSASEVEHLEVT